METRDDYLARQHQRAVEEFISAVLDEVSCDMERNVLGVALRQEVETRLAPELLAIHALLLGADGATLARLPAWLERGQIPLLSDAEFFAEMGRLLDPVAYQVLDENSVLLPGESETSRVFTDYLWEIVGVVMPGESLP